MPLQQGKYEEATVSFNKAISLNPNFNEPRYNLSYLQLTRENFIEGWENHEHRKAKNILFKKLNLKNEKIWNGKKFNGKLLVLGEQGLGDQILFSSMLNDLLNIQKDITVTVEERLLSLLKRSFKKITFLSDKSKLDLENFDKYIFLGSLGKFFRKSIKSFPKNQKPFLTPDLTTLNKIKNYLGNKPLKKIGLSWQTSSPNNRMGRNIPLKIFEPILKLNEYRFIDLQYGDTTLERSSVKNTYGTEIIHINNLNYKDDIEELVGLVTECDLVITIPNFTTQLAGALGVPVFVLLPFASDWRWFLNRSDSPWYPNIKLFRQKRFEEWTSVINKVYKNLIH